MAFFFFASAVTAFLSSEKDADLPHTLALKLGLMLLSSVCNPEGAGVQRGYC